MLSEKLKDAMKVTVDGWIDLKGWAEALDGWVIGMLINLLDTGLLDKIKLEYQNILNEILEAIFIDKDYDMAVQKLSILLTDAIKTPLVDDTPAEQSLYFNTLNTLKTALMVLLEKLQGDEAA